MSVFVFILVAHLMLAMPAAANVLVGLPSDTEVRSDSTVIADNSNALIAGGGGSPALDRAAVFVFQLPDFGAVANPFTSAMFRFHLASKNGTPKNMDLYGLGRRTSGTVLAGDFYGQTTTVDSTDATFLQNNILISTTPNGVVSTGSTATALTNYLNAQYAGGAGAGKYVFLRLSSDAAPGGTNRYNLTSANGGVVGAPDTRPRILYNLPTGYTRPFIWVRDSEKAGILDKIAGNAWATTVFNGMVSRVAADVSSHQTNRDSFLRTLPVVDWSAATPKFKTIPAYSESSVRYAAEAKFNDAQDCAILYYLTGDAKYARCAGDILHNVIKTMLPVAASSSTGNGGWIFQNDLLKEARVTGPQLAIVYDFLHSWLQSNQVYDVKTAGLVNFNFTDAQSFFRRYYQLVRDHGQKESNWSALMATTMLNNLLALDDATERNAALQVYLTTGTSRQASLDYDYRHYTQTGDIWPESLQYAGEVGDVRSTHMVLIERVDPSLNLFDKYPNLPLSLPRISYLRYPNGEQITFGDGHRSAGGQPFGSYELVYQHAKQRGRDDLTTFFGSLVNGGVAEGKYNRSSIRSYGSLSMRDEPLQLLWQAGSLSEPSVSPELPRTDTLPFAGIALQRNPAPSNNSTYGLMCFVGGASHVHSHASGMNMEIFGMGEVMGAKSGRDDYGSAIHENYYRLFASNNTVIVNGASQGDGGWSDIGINTVQTVSMEPQPFTTAVSPDFSFTCSSFADDKGTLAEGTQQRTMAIVRTSPTTGYYVDIFRSKSSLANQFHDYIYRNIGETTVDLRADGVTLPLTSQPARFQSDIGDAYEQPGWRYFTNTKVSAATSQSVKAQFAATVSGTARYMSMHMPAVASREYAKVDSPPIVDAPSPYDTKVAPALVIRQTGEAWNKAFAAVYEPHFVSNGGSVQNVTQLVRSGIVVGAKVESIVGGKNLVQYILSNPNPTETYTDSSIGLTFKGRFGIASDNGDGTVTLYLGDGSNLSYRGNSVTTVSGSNSQAEVRFTPGQPAAVTADTAVTTVVAPPPPNSTWIPTAAGTFNWNSTTNWNPATIPNSIGYTANQNTNLTGNQTISLNIPVTLGELVVGDSTGGETTTLQKGTSGSLVFNQTENAIAYLTRTAGGTGAVTFASDLGISLADNLTIRQTGGSGTIHIAGTISGTGKGITKDGSGLTLALSGANTYTGDTLIAAGILSLDHSLALQNSVIDTTNSVTGDATRGLRTNLTSLTFGGLSGAKNLSSLFTTVSGGYPSITNITLNPGSDLSPSYSAVIANGAPGMSLTKTGQGVQTLTGSNTYNGSTILAANSGKLVIGGAGELGGGTYTGAVSIGSGATLDFATSSDQRLNGPISGSGLLQKSVSTSVLTIGASNASFTGSIGIGKGTIILANANAISAATTLTLASGTALKTSVQNATVNAATTVSGTASIHAPDFGTGSTTSTLTMNGVISGSGNLIFSSESDVASNSNQTVRLNAPNTYTGTTTLDPSDNDSNLILRLGTHNALPVTTVLSINGVAGGGSGRDTTLELNGFSQTITGLQNTAVSLRNQRIINSSTTASVLTIDNSSSHTFSGSINGSNLSLVKNGPGTQTLSGSNSYTGSTTINAGKLRGVTGGNCANSAVTLANAAASLGVSISDNTKTWTCKSLSTDASGTIEFDYGSNLPGTVKPLTIANAASFATTPTVRVVLNSSPPAGTYPLMSWGSVSGTVPTGVSVVKSNGTGGLADGAEATLTVSGNSLNLVITIFPSTVKANNTNNLNLGTSWVGGIAPNASSTASWNSTVTAANTTALGANTIWGGVVISNPGGAVTISNTGGHSLTLGGNATDIGMSAATANLTLNCPLNLGDENVWNVTTGRTLTLGGVVSGAFPIIKQGGGTAVLSAANSFTGEIALDENSGILQIGGSGTLGTGTYASAITIGTGSTFHYNSTSAQTINSPVSGGGVFSKSNSSTLTLGGNNSSFDGIFAINAGTLRLNSAGSLGSATSISIAGGAVLSSELSGITTSSPVTLGATGTTSTIAFGRNTAARGTITFNGPISGDGNLTLTTPNVSSGNNLQTIVLGAPGTYGGNTVISTGNVNNTLTVVARAPDVLPATSVLTLNGGNGTGSGRTVSFDLNGYDQTIAGLTNTTGLTDRNQRILNSGDQSATLSIGNTGDFSFSGNILGTNLSLDKFGPGTQTLANSNSHTGTTTVIEGILSLTHSSALESSALETSASITGNAANGLRTTVTSLTLGGLIGDKNLASVFTTTSGGYGGVTALTLNPPSGITHDYSGIIANGAAGMTVTKSGSGTQVLAGANSYTGNTTISAGTLRLGASNVIPDGSGKGNVTVNGTLDLHGYDEAFNGLDGTGVVDNTAPDTESFLTVGGNNQTTGFAGTLQNSGNSATLSLIKTGTGTFTLSGNNTHTGSTTINGGILLLNSPDALDGTSGIIVNGPSHNALAIGADVVVGNGKSAIINGTGPSNFAGALTSNGGTNEWQGNVTIGSAGTRIGINSTAPSAFTLSGVIDSGTDPHGILFRIQNNSGAIILTNANTYLGVTRIITNGGSLRLSGGSNRLPVTTTLSLGGSTVSGILDLNGQNQEVAGVTVGQTGGTFENEVTSATAATFTVNSSEPSTYSGGITGAISLVKTGPEVLTLTGANTYSGHTTVSQGTLTLANRNDSNNSSTVTIAATGATLQLAFTGTDTVDKLFIGNVPQPAGVYGAIGSSAQFKIPQITGTGTLTVASSTLPPGYDAWKIQNAPTGTPSDDFDGDGVPNAIEYILGGSSSTKDLSKLPTATISGGQVTFTFVRDQASIDGTTTLAIEVGEDLTTWPDTYPVPATAASNDPGLTVQKNTPTSGWDTITLSIPRSPSQRFARLKVTP